MTVQDLIGEVELSVCCREDSESRDITGGYAGDLLSDVMANSRAGNVWVTMQVHVNIVAVAVLKELAAIILVNGRRPADDTLKKAKEENVTILSANRPAYELIARLHAAGVGSES